jgi:hypothetical protein
MPPAAIVGVGLAGGIAGNIIQGNAAKKSAAMQAGAADRATALQREMFEQQRADAQPWRQAGVDALAGMQDADFKRDFTAADFQKDPGYDFRMQEGQKVLERSAAARGGLQSGGTMKALAQYGQNFASNEYGNAYNRFNADRERRFNRLASLAGAGQTANSQIAAAGQNYANNASNNMMGAANAQAAAHMQGASGWSNLLGGLGGLGMAYNQASWMDTVQKGLEGGMKIGRMPQINLGMQGVSGFGDGNRVRATPGQFTPGFYPNM